MAPSRVRRGTFGAFRRPFLTDPVFWIAAVLALLVGAVISAALMALGGEMPDSALSWAVAGLIFAVAAWLSFKLLAMGLNTSRALDEAQAADEGRAAKLEGTGRAAGATLGKGAARLMGRSKGSSSSPAGAAPSAPAPAPAPAPASTPAPAASAPEEKPDVTVDKAARVLGSMVGRRLADRKKD